jgi:hypothetical protein
MISMLRRFSSSGTTPGKRARKQTTDSGEGGGHHEARIGLHQRAEDGGETDVLAQPRRDAVHLKARITIQSFRAEPAPQAGLNP